MKSLVAILLFAAFQSSIGLDLNPDSIEPIIQAVGHRTKKDGACITLMQFKKSDWTQINKARKVSGKEVLPFEQVNTVPWQNREYAFTYLSRLIMDLTKELDGEPSDEQLLMFLILGKSFEKAGWDVEKVEDQNAMVRLDLYRQIKANTKNQELPPINVPRPLPTRYTPPRASEHR